MNGTGIINDQNIIKFPELGWEFKIDPTAFTIGGFEVQWYGIIIALGLLLAVLYCFPRMKRFGIDSDRAADVVIGGVIGGIIGARAYYVIMQWQDYSKDTLKETFLAVINTRNGGLAIYGGIIGAVLAGLVISKIRKVKVLPMLDIAALGFLIGQGIGRWGNFVNQEAFGTNTDFVLGMTGGRIQSIASTMPDLSWDKPVHPCFFYESVWCLLGFALLAFWSKHRKYDGQLTLMYMAWYGLERFIVEGLRIDSLMVGNIRISQALSAILFIVSVILQIVIFFRRKRDPERYVLYAGTEESIQLIEESRRKKMGVKGSDANIMSDDEDDEIGILPDEDDEEDMVQSDDPDSDDKDSRDNGSTIFAENEETDSNNEDITQSDKPDSDEEKSGEAENENSDISEDDEETDGGNEDITQSDEPDSDEEKSGETENEKTGISEEDKVNKNADDTKEDK